MTGPFAWLLALLGFRALDAEEGVVIAVPGWLSRRCGRNLTVELVAYPKPGTSANPLLIAIDRPWE